MKKKLNFLVSAGPTREYIDAVRFLTNASSGKMGYAIAAAVVAAGHNCHLVSGPVHLPVPEGVTVDQVISAIEMKDVVCNNFAQAHVVIMTAAVADYRPMNKSVNKIHKDGLTMMLELQQNPDIIRELNRFTEHQIIVGFAAETEDMLASGQRKLEAKGMDFVVANNVALSSAGFNSEFLDATILFKNGDKHEFGQVAKKELAIFIVEQAVALAEAKAQLKPIN